MRSIVVIAACIIGGVIVTMLPMADLASVLGDLITIFTILAALLAQMIALTAVIFEPGRRMSAESVREVGSSVRKLQTLNIGLFVIYILALGLFVMMKAMQAHHGVIEFEMFSAVSRLGWHSLRFGTFMQFVAGAIVSLAIIRTFRTLFAIRTLQDLRIEAQAKDAEARDRLNRDAAAERLRPVPDQGGAAYGEFTHLPRNNGKRKGGAR